MYGFNLEWQKMFLVQNLSIFGKTFCNENKVHIFYFSCLYD